MTVHVRYIINFQEMIILTKLEMVYIRSGSRIFGKGGMDKVKGPLAILTTHKTNKCYKAKQQGYQNLYMFICIRFMAKYLSPIMKHLSSELHDTEIIGRLLCGMQRLSTKKELFYSFNLKGCAQCGKSMDCLCVC